MPTLAFTDARYEHATRTAVKQAQDVRKEIATKSALKRLERRIIVTIKNRRCGPRHH